MFRRRFGPSGVYVAISISRSVLNFITLPLLVAALPQRELAAVTLLLPIWWISQSFFSLGISEGIIRPAARRAPGVGGAVLLATVVIVTVGSITTFAVLSLASDFFSVASNSTIVAAFGTGIGQSLTTTASAALRGAENVRAAAATLAAASYVPLLLGIFFAFVQHTAEGYLGGLMLGTFIAAIVGLFLCVRLMPPERGLSQSTVVAGEAIRVGLPLTPQVTAVFLLEIASKQLVLRLAGVDALATFGLAVAGAGFVTSIVKSAGTGWTPVVLTLDQRATQFRVARFFWGTTALTVLAQVGAIVGERLLLSSAFLDSVDYDISGLGLALVIALTNASGTALCVMASTLAIQHGRTAHFLWLTPLSVVAAYFLALALALNASWPTMAAAAPLSQMVLAGTLCSIYPLIRKAGLTVSRIFLGSFVGLPMVLVGSRVYVSGIAVGLVVGLLLLVFWRRSREQPVAPLSNAGLRGTDG